MQPRSQSTFFDADVAGRPARSDEVSELKESEDAIAVAVLSDEVTEVDKVSITPGPCTLVIWLLRFLLFAKTLALQSFLNWHKRRSHLQNQSKLTISYIELETTNVTLVFGDDHWLAAHK